MQGRFSKSQIPWNKGKSLSIEHRNKLSAAKIGKIGPWAGKTRPDMSKENNPNYGKFGKEHPKWTEQKKHPFHKSIRDTYKYRQWRSDVFTRDNFTCVICGDKGFVQADHYPKAFIKIVDEYQINTLDKAIECEEMWNINNGRTLCVPCHKDTDNWGRRRN